MPITYADLLDVLVDMIDQDRDSKALVLTKRTAQEAVPGLSSVATPEHTAMISGWQGGAGYDAMIAAEGGNQEAASTAALSFWVPFAARYLRDNDTSSEGVQPTLSEVARALVQNMLDDAQTCDASAPTAGAVVYQERNQGDGTATIAINSDTTLAELALAGTVKLRCMTAGFSVQNEERWQLEWTGINPRAGGEQTRYSLSRDFKTGARYFDVVATQYPGVGISPSARDQEPQRGGNIHTALNILISAPSYAAPVDTGDTDSAFSAFSVMTKVGTKTNCTRRNTTYVWHTSNPNGTIYLRVVKDGLNFNCTWYQDSGLTVALTNTQTFTVAGGTVTGTWLAAATNPEVFLPGGHLAVGDTFLTCTVTGANLLSAAVTISLAVNLPWGVGDVISSVITNAYAGVISRFLTQELGFAVPVNNAAGETIADPA